MSRTLPTLAASLDADAPLLPGHSRLVHVTGPRVMADRAAYGVTYVSADAEGTLHRMVVAVTCAADLDAAHGAVLSTESNPAGERMSGALAATLGARIDRAWLAALFTR